MKNIGALLFMTLAFMLIPVFSTHAACALPAKLGNQLGKKFPGWKVVELINLRSDDQRLWADHHQEECPGIALGRFEPATRETYAITLFKKNSDLTQLLVVANRHQNSFKFMVLDGPRKVAYLSVISRRPPGRYVDIEGSKFSVGLDSISYEAIEAGEIWYHYQDGKFVYNTMSE